MGAIFSAFSSSGVDFSSLEKVYENALALELREALGHGIRRAPYGGRADVPLRLNRWLWGL